MNYMKKYEINFTKKMILDVLKIWYSHKTIGKDRL